MCESNDRAEALLGVLGTWKHGYFELGNRGTMTKCLREQGDIASFREQKAGNKCESNLGNKGPK